MGGQSNGRKRRAQREKQRRKRQRTSAAALEAEFGPITKGIGRNYQRLMRYWDNSEDREQAAALARQEMRAALDAAADASRGLGLVHAVTGLRTHMALMSALTGIEPSAAGLELLALALSGEVEAAEAGEEAEQAYEPESVRRQIMEAIEAGCMIALFSVEPADQNSLIVFQTVQREILMRSGTYQHILLDTLRNLFSDPTVNSDCAEVLGFMGSDAVDVMAAVRAIAIRNLQGRHDRMFDMRERMAPIIEQSQQGTADPDPAATKALLEEFKTALEDLTTHVDTATVIDPAEVAIETGIAVDTVEALLDAYTYKPVDLDTALDRFFTGDNPLRTAPIVTDVQGRRMLVHDALALPAVSEVIETRLKSAGKTDAFYKRRGVVAEDEALDLLAGVYPGATVHRGFEYFVPDPDVPVAQTSPETYTKLVEGDGLVVIDDVALIIEVKANALNAKARSGVAVRLRDQLGKIITKAAEQADRLRERIADDGQLRLRDGSMLDLSNVREIHTIAVSLEDLSGVSTTTAALIDAGLLPPDTVPWTVSVHDLRIICELLERPSELLFYLRRRSNPDATRKFFAVDELDLYLYALEHGLFVVPDPERRAAAMPFKAEASVADKRRFAAQRPTLIESQTEPLDAWYAAKIDPDRPEVAKPALNVDADLLVIVDALAATGEPGWLSTAATLLEQDARWQRDYARMPRDLARQTRIDGRSHQYTSLMEDYSGGLHVLVLGTQAGDETQHQPPVPPEVYLAAKKYQTKALRGTVIDFDVTGTTIKRVIFNNSRNDPDPELDALLPQLRPLERTTAKVPRPGRGSKPRRSNRKRKRKR